MKKILVGLSAGIAASLAVVGNAFAILNADQLLVTGSIDTMISDMATWGWTAILAMVTFLIGAKLFKRFMGAAT